MKAGYQKGMIYAAVIAGIVLVGPLWLWSILSPRSIATIRPRIPNVNVPGEVYTPPETTPTKRNVGGRPDDPTTFHGQFGVIVHVIPDSPPVVVAKPTSLVHTTEKLAAVVDTNISVSDTTDGPSGPYVPENAEYTFTPPPETTAVQQDIVPCSVLKAVKPVYPFVARSARKEGMAGIIVCVDEQGKVSLFPDDIIRQFQEHKLPIQEMTVKVDGHKERFNYVVTLEQPDGYFFAKMVAEILPKWEFAPSRVDGQPVKSLVPIGNAFCLTDSCQQEAKLQNYKQYTP